MADSVYVRNSGRASNDAGTAPKNRSDGVMTRQSHRSCGATAQQQRIAESDRMLRATAKLKITQKAKLKIARKAKLKIARKAKLKIAQKAKLKNSSEGLRRHIQY